MKSLSLTLDLFTNVKEDVEKRQYLILAALKQMKKEFTANKLYPYLKEMIQMRNNLSQIIEMMEKYRNETPKRIKSIDLETRQIEMASVLPEDVNLGNVGNLIEWALPHFDAVITEGVTIFEFVNDNIVIEPVGIVPGYRDEGYLFINNQYYRELQLFRFELSIFHRFDERFRAIKTLYLKTVGNEDMLRPSVDYKIELATEYKELPNPATYEFRTSLDMPFDETLFPIIKRLLLEYLFKEQKRG